MYLISSITDIIIEKYTMWSGCDQVRLTYRKSLTSPLHAAYDMLHISIPMSYILCKFIAIKLDVKSLNYPESYSNPKSYSFKESRRDEHLHL